jgi:hypothetical protein
LLNKVREKGRVWGFEHLLRTKSGQSIPGMYYADTIMVGASRRLLSIIVDISERRRLLDERDTLLRLLGLVNSPGNMDDLLRGVTGFLEGWSGCEKVSVCLGARVAHCPGCPFPPPDDHAGHPDLQLVSNLGIFHTDNASRMEVPAGCHEEEYRRCLNEGYESIALIPMYSALL